MTKRKWCYVLNPKLFDMSCDKCNGTNITWSEYENHIWCYDCNIDTLGNKGIFDGPIPIQLVIILGFNFDKIDLETNKILKCSLINEELKWISEEEWKEMEAFSLLSDQEMPKDTLMNNFRKQVELPLKNKD